MNGSAQSAADVKDDCASSASASNASWLSVNYNLVHRGFPLAIRRNQLVDVVHSSQTNGHEEGYLRRLKPHCLRPDGEPPMLHLFRCLARDPEQISTARRSGHHV